MTMGTMDMWLYAQAKQQFPAGINSPNTPQEKKMTREEAVKVVREQGYGAGDFARAMVGSLEKLGVLKLEQPKSVRDQAVEALTKAGCGGWIVGILERAGLKIVKE